MPHWARECVTDSPRLLGRVALGEVGMVLSIEVARLARTDKDWCHLLELCRAFGTLIADADHIYDLTTMDDQLVLDQADIEHGGIEGSQKPAPAGTGREGAG